MNGGEWSDLENDAIVADYFAMLSDELAGRRYNKAAHNKALQDLVGRAKGSIEFKHQNISAVHKGLGETWIIGYKPAFNFQMSLVDAVARHLQHRGGWIARTPTSSVGMSDAPGAIWIGTPPTIQNTPPPDELEQMQAVARKFDVAGRDERNRSLGKAGEERVLIHERATLSDVGRQDLAERVRWVSQEDGDGAGYDISSFTPDGQSRLIEVKMSCRRFRDNEGRLQLHALAYNLGVFLQRADLPEEIIDWSLTSLQSRLIKIGARVVRHARTITFQLAKVAVTGGLFQSILTAIHRLRARPSSA